MNTIDTADAVHKVTKPSRLKAGITRFAFAAVLIIGLALCRNWIVGRTSAIPFETLAQAAESMAGVKSMHITARMRNTPGDSFEFVSPNLDLVTVDLWKVFGDTPKWRVEKKPGRVITMDGKTTLVVVQPNIGKAMAIKLPPNALGTIGWLSPLLQIDTLFRDEQESAKKQGSQVSVQENGSRVVLIVNAKAQGDFSQSKYLKNKTIMDSDNTRVYTFDAATHRLQSMQVYMNIKVSKVLVFETTAIQYDTPVDPSLLKADIPEGARMVELPEETVNASGNTAKTPEDAARAIFKDMSDTNWEALHAYAGTLFDDPKFHDILGGLKVISIGKAFRSGSFNGYFVPYEIRLKSGDVLKRNLTLKNDNPKHLWTFAGGL